jgi:hypothetical protein
MGGFPDLRYTPYLGSDAAFKAVVIDGVLTENGMLSFKKVLTADDAEAIRAHLTRVANNLKANPPPAFGRGPGGAGGPGGPRSPAAPATAAAPAEQAGLHQ